MPICFVNADGSHVQGCERHTGLHPYDWCIAATDARTRKIAELRAELNQLQIVDIGPYNDDGGRGVSLTFAAGAVQISGAAEPRTDPGHCG